MAKALDVPLQVGVGQPTTVLKVLEEMRPQLERGRHAMAVAERNERYLNGKQWLGLSGNDEIVSMARMPWEPIVTKNVLRPLWYTWAARILKQGASSKAYPANATPGDIAKAFVANTLLDYQRQIQDRDSLNMLCALLAQAHGSIGVLVTWDRYKGKHPAKRPAQDEFQNDLPELVDFEDEGDVRLEILTIFDFCTDGSEQVEDSQWLLVRRWLSPHDAEARFVEAGFPPQVSVTQRKNSASKDTQGQDVVEGWELYHKRCPRFPAGFYACVIGDKVVEHTESYPYEHGELPIAVWKVQDKRDSPYGETA